MEKESGEIFLGTPPQALQFANYREILQTNRGKRIGSGGLNLGEDRLDFSQPGIFPFGRTVAESSQNITHSGRNGFGTGQDA